MAIQSHTVQENGNDIKIYAETANIQYFVNATMEADEDAGPTNAQTSVASYSRRQYPGDPTPVSVAGATREYLVDPSRRSGTALPGKNFELAAFNAQGVETERRRFTYVGRFMDLHAWLTGEAKYDLSLYNHTGARYSIPKAAVGP